AFIGDSSLVEDSTPKYVREDNGRTKKTYDGFKEQDNSKSLENITTWFGKQDHTPNLKETGIKLDQPTPLLNFEQPQHSTEPEKEPWSQPPSGYKWYDRSTFKLGSYGSTSSQLNSNHKNHGSHNGNNKANSTKDNTTENNHSQEDTNTSQSSQDTTTSNSMISSNNVQFHLPDNVSVNQPFNIQVELTNMAKNTTIDHLKLGVYQDGGRQLARFSQDGQNYDTVGYSQEQSVTTDDQGNATLTFTAKTSESISGANIRLKQGSKTLATGSIQ
ncbi:MAG: DNA-binding protein, partial [Staphylococcus hominis]